jgi:hypothetical protein
MNVGHFNHSVMLITFGSDRFFHFIAIIFFERIFLFGRLACF